MGEVGLRERKKAHQKIAIMEAMVAALENAELADIHVTDLCRTLGISRVTFFNYFSSKEAVVEYFVQCWHITIALELRARGIGGRAALTTIFDSIGTHPAGQHVMNAVALFMLKVDQYVPVPMTEYERRLIAGSPDPPTDLPTNLTELFVEALTPVVSDAARRSRVARQLIVGLYGVPIRTRIAGDADLASAYREYLDVVIPRA